MDELEKWLTSVGLAAIAPTLRANDVDLDILPELSEADLEKLGLSLGQRRRLLRAVATIGSEPQPAPPPPQPEPPPVPAPPRGSAERRQVTVMFCDMVGSTALSARLDPEDMREILDAYYRRTSEIIIKAGGFVGRYIGDGILAYFGYPQALEDAAERAVRAGLALAEAVPTLPTRHEANLQIRIGIATGIVVIGDLLGEGTARDQGAVGDTPNLGARLQAEAGPGEVVICPDTRRLAGGHFEYKDVGRLTLKGIPEPVQAWQVVGTRAVESRFAARHEAVLAPLVGRSEELELLLRQWRLAQEGHGSVVLLSGEPGIGKSRIVQAVVERIGEDSHTPLHYFCSPHHQDSAFYPIINFLERAAGFRREDSAEQRLDKLEELLAQSTKDVASAGTLFAGLLSIPSDSRFAQLDLAPQVRKERTLRALMAQIEGLAATKPVLLIVEDLHWSDASTLEVLDLVVEQAPGLPLLVIGTFRPEFEAQWSRHAHVSRINLSRLGTRHCAEMISGVVDGRALPQEIADQIVSRTDGVPLFIEELTKAVLESGALTAAGDKYVASGPLPTNSIPLTLQASLLARLDHLAPAREIAQIGAALGRQFSHELISAVAAMPQTQLDDALGQLVGAELIYRRGVPPDAEYTFKHALVQDAAYSTLLRARRLALHGRIVDALESRFAELAAAQPQVVAHHCAEAARHEKAIVYRMKAAQLAAGRSAIKEAEAQLRRALELVKHLAESTAREKLELDLLVPLARALIATQGHAAPEVAEVQARARLLWEKLGQPPASWISNQFEYRLTRAELGHARTEALNVLESGRRGSNALTTIAGCNMCATVSLFLGDFRAGSAYGQEALDLFDADPRAATDRGAIYRRTVARSYLFLSQYYLGHLDRALQQAREANSAAQSHAVSLALAMACGLHVEPDPALLAKQCERLASHSSEHGFPIFAAHATVFFGSATSALGQFDDGLETVRKGLTAYRATGALLQLPVFLTELAKACGRSGRAEEGLEHLEEALQVIEHTDERWTEVGTLRARGELLIATGKAERGEKSLHDAIAAARRQEAKLWELRAAGSLARLWQEQGKAAAARDLLAPLCGWFTEGLETRDLRDAHALLRQLG